jgi:hypothetical protein
MNQSSSQIILYQTKDGKTRIDVTLDDETVWLTQDQMAELFDKGRSTITEHIQNIFKEGELEENSVCRNFRRTGNDDKQYLVKYYNLDVIISVGYRVKSHNGTQFRIWATQKLKEYIVKGFAIDAVRLKQGGHKSRYFEELLQVIRDIRSSERMLYQKVTDIYATSIDYNKDDEMTNQFFATVQNKMHFAVTGKTAAEIIKERANSAKPFMGLTNFSGSNLIKRDIYIAKNYLKQDELLNLNDIVDAYLSFAEIQAKNQQGMSMKDWTIKLDEYLTLLGKGVLNHAGKISAVEAGKIVLSEFEKYKKEQDKSYISDFDREVKKVLNNK